MYYGKLKCLNCGKITASGWVKEQLERSKKGMGGNLDILEPEMIYNPYINKTSAAIWGNIAAGWGSEISGNYWYGLILLAFTLPDKELQAKAEDWVNKVLAGVGEDGYIGGYGENDDLSEDYNAWGSGCGIRALALYAECTGREDVFEAVHKSLLWFCRTDKWSFTAYAGPFIMKLMSYCYSRCGDKELLDFCEKYEAWLDEEKNDSFRTSTKAFLDDKFYYNQNHAAAYGIHLGRPAEVYLSDGKEERLKASLNAAQKLHKHSLMVNGGISGNAEWLSPNSAVGENEYCTTTFMCESYAAIAAATGDAIWGDYIENMIFNVAEGSRKKDEKAIAYFTSPNQICATEESSYATPHGMYAPLHRTSCCAVNSVVIIPEFVKNIAMQDKNADLYFLSFAPCKISHKNADIEVDTLYPFRKNITMKVSTDGNIADFNIYLKKPSWCEKIIIKAPNAVGEVNKNGFIKVWGSFNNGDIIEIEAEMTARVVITDDSDAADKQPLSVLYGPLCFCLPVKEKWVDKGNGYALTPLPDGWSWYSIEKDFSDGPLGEAIHRLDNHTWNFATTKEVLESSIEIKEEEINGYVWENPPITIKVDGWHSPYLYNHYTPRTNDFYGKKVPVTFKKTVELVPFGCTNLRITCFPQADAE